MPYAALGCTIASGSSIVFKFFSDHPIWGSILAFVVVTGPQWLNAIWGLFVSEPMAIAVQRKVRGMNLPTFSASWITVPLGLLMFAVILYTVQHKRNMSFDYSYGLALQGVTFSYDDAREPPTLQFGLILANAADGPIKFEVQSFDVIIADHTKAEPVFTNRTGVIPRGMTTTFFYPSFNDEGLQRKEGHLDGVIRFTIVYGHPDEDRFLRRTSTELTFTVRTDKSGIAWLLQKQSDEGIEK